MHADLHEGELHALRGAWEALYQADHEATPQSSFPWAAAWHAHWAPEARPLVVVVSGGTGPVGLAAFSLHRRGPLRLLRAFGEYPSDYWDVLSEPALRADVADVVARCLAESGGWDAIVLSHLSPGSPMAAALSRAGLESLEMGHEPYPGMPLPETFEEYLGSLPQQRRTNLRRRLRNLDQGEVELREISQRSEIPAAVGRWQELRVRQWRQLGKDLAPEHSKPRFASFLSAALDGLMERGQVAFWEFWQEARLVGSYISLVDERCFYQYLGGYDPAFAKLGIGKIAVGHGIRTSIEAGRAYYDFMMGGEEYKYWYGASDRFCASFLLWGSGARSRAAGAAIAWRRRRR